MFQYFFHPRAEKELAQLPIREQERIVAKIKELCKLSHPLQHRKVKKLKGREFEEFRLRVGDYRVKFILVNVRTIKIIHIQHRQIGY